MNEIDNRKSIEKWNKKLTLKKINKINKSLIRLNKQKRQEDTITKIRNERVNITTDPVVTKIIIKMLLYCHKFNNLDRMDQFLERHNLPKVIQETIDDLSRRISVQN